MSIASEISRLLLAKADIKEAIKNKGIIIPLDATIDKYATYINSYNNINYDDLEKPIKFFGWGGKVVYSYTPEEFAELESLPENPTHIGFVGKGWNWSFLNAKTYAAKYKRLNVGLMWVPKDGATHIIIDTRTWDIRKHYYKFWQSKANGIRIDWGDGSPIETASTNYISLEHTYDKGVYELIIYSDLDTEVKIGVTSVAYGSLFGYWYSNEIESLLRGIKAVYLGERVIDIGRLGIVGGLYELTLGDRLTTLGSYVRLDGNYTWLTLPKSLTTITRNSTFMNCFNLTSICLSDSITDLPSNTFQYCFSLMSLTIPETITTINSNTFYQCYSLVSLVIPDSVVTIAASAFAYCCLLSSLYLSNAVTTLGNEVFTRAENLIELIFPASITSIGSNISNNLYGIQRLTAIYMLSTIPPTITLSTFNNTNNCPIYVPAGTLEAYQTALYWSTTAVKNRLLEMTS